MLPTSSATTIFQKLSGFTAFATNSTTRGTGLAVERQKVVAYAEIAKGIFHQLFGLDLSVSRDPADSKNSLPSAIAGRSFEHFADSAKGWFYLTADERNDFAATANAKGSCSLRIFDSDTGQF